MNDYHSQGSRPLPPFGRVLLAYQQESIRLDWHITVYVGKNSKDQAFVDKRAGQLATFLPFGEDFNNYRWPVREQKLIVLDTGSMKEIYLIKFCLHLIDAGAHVIFLYSEQHPNQLILPAGRQYNG